MTRALLPVSRPAGWRRPQDLAPFKLPPRPAPGGLARQRQCRHRAGVPCRLRNSLVVRPGGAEKEARPLQLPRCCRGVIAAGFFVKIPPAPWQSPCEWDPKCAAAIGIGPGLGACRRGIGGVSRLRRAPSACAAKAERRPAEKRELGAFYVSTLSVRLRQSSGLQGVETQKSRSVHPKDFQDFR